MRIVYPGLIARRKLIYMKFLVLWHFDIARLTPEVTRAVMEQPKYAEKLAAGKHGGAWIYKVGSNEELDMLLAASPVYNFATYEVLPLAEMSGPSAILNKAG